MGINIKSLNEQASDLAALTNTTQREAMRQIKKEIKKVKGVDESYIAHDLDISYHAAQVIIDSL